ncbi:MAG: hypothetical protein LBV02_01850 [Bacteroidales bacterium]|jgi:hypothetical protein|nr:hypothetical protein [Bacteroidales bacterium]
MKRFGFFLCILLVFNTGFAQHSLKDSTHATGKTVQNPFGEFAYQYNRIIAADHSDPQKVIITFVFINGNATTAIQYRQEAMTGTVEWLDTDRGRSKKEKFVEVITATVPPNHIVSWKYSFTPKTKTTVNAKIKTMKVDKAALLILDDNMKTIKEIFPLIELQIAY